MPLDSSDELGATLHNIEGRVTGTLLRLPGGALNYAFGAEYARSTVNSGRIRSALGDQGSSNRHAFFGEATLPIFGRGYTLPLMKQLVFNIAARRDVTASVGAIGTVDNVAVDQGGQIIYAKSSFGRTTPAFGVLWSPANSLAIRARINIIGSTYESLTWEASYLLETGIGSFRPKLIYVDNLKAETIGRDASFRVSRLGTILGVDNHRINASVEWNKGPFSANLFAYHIPSYLNDYYSNYFAGELRNPELVRKVDALTTFDLTASWVVSRKLSVQFAGRNIFKAAAPLAVVENLPYDAARYNVAGRTLALSGQLAF